MRHKYQTRGIVIARAPFGEGHARLAVVTEELGLVYARASGIRAPRSKLAHALTTFAESDLVLVEGVEGWRVAGAVLAENWFERLGTPEERERAGRVTGLLLRLSPGEAREAVSYVLLREFFTALTKSEPTLAEGAELVAAENLIAAFGVGESKDTQVDFTPASLAQAVAERIERIARINRGIEISGL